MAREEAREKNFRGFEVYINVFDAQKNSGKPGFFRSFPFTLRERSRMMRMSVHKESLVLRALYTGIRTGNQKKLKGELWQS